MIFMAVASALAVGLAPQQQVDTTFTVRSGGTLEVESQHGSVVITTWDREAVRVRTSTPVNARPRIRYSGGVVDIETNPRGGSQNVALEITLPRNFDVNLEGVNFAVTVDGVQGDVAVETMQGAVNVRGVTGDIDIEAVNGEVAVDNVRGNIVVEATNQNVRLTNIRGNIEVETTNGSITMLRAESTVVEVSTINGIIQYDGNVVDGGRYYLGTHNGSISMSFPERSNAAVQVNTTNGQVQSTFAIPVTSTRTRRFNFTLGSGSARVELESFNGSVRLVRPGSR